MESNIVKLRQYSSAIHVEDFIDYLISLKYLDESAYYEVYSKSERSRLNEIFNKISSKGNYWVEQILHYLNDLYPNIEAINEDERKFKASSVRGGFPKLPPDYIKRKTLAAKVKQEIEILQWDKKLVIYGMMGYGKSCLVNEVLNDVTIRKYFDYNLFWINLGEHHNAENVLQPMWRLYASASIAPNKNSYYPDDVQILKSNLKDLFLEKRLKNALLILDDVCDAHVLSFFDIGCKTIITTQDRKILRREGATFVEVKTGFSMTESMELFKKSLNIQTDLPLPAEEVHTTCKGHPMLISLIASYLKDNREDVYSNKRLWQYIKDMLLQGNYRLNEYDDHLYISTEIIKKCVEKLLTNDLKAHYEELAIFMQDVNIPPEVLAVLWNKEKFTVRNIMNKFAEKSLVMPFYHNDLKTFIYGVHDIHLNYLREETKDRIIHIHRKLISRYDEITDGNYAQLPNDNYTLQFIGYHLYNANRFDKFHIYFDFGFIQAKIKAVGKEDILRDMQKYEEFITNKDNILTERLNQYKEFIRQYGGSLYNYPDTDILQYALQEDKESFIYKEALTIAKSSKKLYFQFQRPVDKLDFSQTIPVKDDITAACFVDSPHHILIGTVNGKIKLFYEQYEKEIASFVGHYAAIKNLHVSPDKSHFLSISEDKTVILWKFSARNSMDLSYLPVSPKTKQREWQDVFTPDRGKVLPKQKFYLSEEDYLISANFSHSFPEVYRIITGTFQGTVIIWDAKTGLPISQTPKRGFEAPCVMYIKNKLMELIIFACDESIFKFEVEEQDLSVKLVYSEQLRNNEKCTSLFLNEREIIAVGEKNITLWRGTKPHRIFQEDELKKQNICATVTNDSKYLVISTNEQTVYIWDIRDKKVLREFKNKGLAKSLDTFYDKDSAVHILLIGSDKKTLQQCHIQPCDKEPHVANSPIVVPYWKRKQPLNAIVTSENRIEVLRGYVHISETEVIASKVTCACFCLCGNNILYGLDTGEVYCFSIRSKTQTLMESVHNKGAITYLKYFNGSKTMSNSGDNLIDCNSSGTYNGIIVAVSDTSESNVVTVYNNEKTIFKTFGKSILFLKSTHLIIVENNFKLYSWFWNLNVVNSISLDVGFDSNMIKTEVTTGALYDKKNLLAITCNQQSIGVLYVIYFNEEATTAKLKYRKWFETDDPKCCTFSCDGSLLAVGMMSGVIHVWNTQENYSLTTMELHQVPVEHLLFSPSIDPILVSLGEQVVWWNLKSLKKVPKFKGRPKSIEILENGGSLCLENMGLWFDREISQRNVLSCLKLHGKAKFISASDDFSSFLCIDDKGKLYIIEAIFSHIM